MYLMFLKFSSFFLPKSFTYMDGLNNNQLNIYNAKGSLEHH